MSKHHKGGPIPIRHLTSIFNLKIYWSCHQQLDTGRYQIAAAGANWYRSVITVDSSFTYNTCWPPARSPTRQVSARSSGYLRLSAGILRFSAGILRLSGGLSAGRCLRSWNKYPTCNLCNIIFTDIDSTSTRCYRQCLDVESINRNIIIFIQQRKAPAACSSSFIKHAFSGLQIITDSQYNVVHIHHNTQMTHSSTIRAGCESPVIQCLGHENTLYHLNTTSYQESTVPMYITTFVKYYTNPELYYYEKHTLASVQQPYLHKRHFPDIIFKHWLCSARCTREYKLSSEPYHSF